MASGLGKRLRRAEEVTRFLPSRRRPALRATLLPALFLPEFHMSPIVPSITRVRITETADNLGESPVWDGDAGRIYWVDGVSCLVRYHAGDDEAPQQLQEQATALLEQLVK